MWWVGVRRRVATFIMPHAFALFILFFVYFFAFIFFFYWHFHRDVFTLDTRNLISYEVGSLTNEVDTGRWFNKSWEDLWTCQTQTTRVLLGLDTRVLDLDERLQQFEKALNSMG